MTVADATRLADRSTVEADVCVVGAGPAGLTVAHELAERADVLVVESGDLVPGRTGRRLSRGERTGYPGVRLEASRVRAVGGTSNHWFLDEAGFRARPLDPIDFEPRPGLPFGGWPFGPAELDGPYRRAQQLLGLGAFAYEYADWAMDAPGQPLDLGDPPLRTVMFQLTSSLRFPSFARAFASAPGIRVLTGATVTGLVLDAGGSVVRGAEARTTAGTAFTIRARHFVLAGGGLENARLLLLGRLPVPDGRHAPDLVGRFFMDHLWVSAGLVRPSDPRLLGQVDLYRKHRSGDVLVDAKLAPREELVREAGILNSSFFIDPVGADEVSEATRAGLALRDALAYRRRPPGLRGDLGAIVRAPLPPARVLVRHGLRRRPAPALLSLVAMSEQAPNPDSRVTLGRRRDPFGIPVPRLDWRLTPLDLRSIAFATELIDEAFRARGLGHVDRAVRPDSAPFVHGCWHQLGTTRMADDPRAGVVDRDGRLHGSENLFVTGGSVFPTGGYANPTLTIVALAARLANHLASLLDTGAGPPRAEPRQG